jgi:hypothetical protein
MAAKYAHIERPSANKLSSIHSSKLGEEEKANNSNLSLWKKPAGYKSAQKLARVVGSGKSKKGGLKNRRLVSSVDRLKRS